MKRKIVLALLSAVIVTSTMGSVVGAAAMDANPAIAAEADNEGSGIEKKDAADEEDEAIVAGEDEAADATNETIQNNAAMEQDGAADEGEADGNIRNQDSELAAEGLAEEPAGIGEISKIVPKNKSKDFVYISEVDLESMTSSYNEINNLKDDRSFESLFDLYVVGEDGNDKLVDPAACGYELWRTVDEGALDKVVIDFVKDGESRKKFSYNIVDPHDMFKNIPEKIKYTVKGNTITISDIGIVADGHDYSEIYNFDINTTSKIDSVKVRYWKQGVDGSGAQYATGNISPVKGSTVTGLTPGRWAIYTEVFGNNSKYGPGMLRLYRKVVDIKEGTNGAQINGDTISYTDSKGRSIYSAKVDKVSKLDRYSKWLLKYFVNKAIRETAKTSGVYCIEDELKGMGDEDVNGALAKVKPIIENYLKVFDKDLAGPYRGYDKNTFFSKNGKHYISTKKTRTFLSRYSKYQANLKAAVKAAKMSPKLSVEENHKRAVKYIKKTFKHDSKYGTYFADTAFNAKKGIGKDYASAYYYMMKAAGVKDVKVISGKAKIGKKVVNQTWNRVKIGKIWYYVDSHFADMYNKVSFEKSKSLFKDRSKYKSLDETVKHLYDI